MSHERIQGVVFILRVCFHPRMSTSSEVLQSATADDAPSPALTPTAKAIWLAKAGKWHEAHDLCQDLPDPDGAWIHAWLHREEGDYGNACYWYSRARKSAPAADAPLAEELREIAEALLD